MQAKVTGLLYGSRPTKKSTPDKPAYLTTLSDIDTGDKVLIVSPTLLNNGERLLKPAEYILDDFRVGTGIYFASAIAFHPIN